MRLLEYEGKEIFENSGIPTPKGKVIKSTDQVEEAINEIGLPLVLKVQVPIGGRGKAGGVKIVESEDEAMKMAEELLNKEIKGYEVSSLLAEEELEIDKEMYCGIRSNREEGVPEVIVSSKGGVDIEKIAEESPVVSKGVDPLSGLEAYQAREIIDEIGVEKEIFSKMSKILHRLYNVYTSFDAKLSEINPLVVTGDGDLVASDSKIVIDDHSLNRHPEYKEKIGQHIQNPLEREGEEKGVNYVDLDGEIAIMANGAGLAMAIMDMINLEGASPAAFLDTGGGLSRERMKNALKIFLKKEKQDEKVKAILLNIWLLISPPDAMVNGLFDAIEEMGEPDSPIILVLQGRGKYVKKGSELLKGSNVELYSNVREGVLEAIKRAKGA